MSDRTQAAIDAGKAAPAIAITFGAQVAQWSVQDWAYALTVVYTALLITQWLWRTGRSAWAWWQKRKAT